MLFITDVKMFWRTETDEKALTEVEREVERERVCVCMGVSKAPKRL